MKHEKRSVKRPCRGKSNLVTSYNLILRLAPLSTKISIWVYQPGEANCEDAVSVVPHEGSHLQL